jgi:integrase
MRPDRQGVNLIVNAGRARCPFRTVHLPRRSPVYSRRRTPRYRDPVDRIELGRAPRRPKPRAFSDEDLRKIFEWFENRDERDKRPTELRLTSYKRYNLWKFFLYAGCRSAEALELTWKQVSDVAVTFDGEITDEEKHRGFPLAPFPELRELIDELRAMRDRRSDRVFHWWDTTQGITDAM